ncbi:hypothetical protein LEP1GSC133_0039 [Leptospira borgpetersenii serovar Pomona str. 200901868]|uniref:Uncharacterized protein n=1 Tax=Leptospira borgpetersenii serovar Pomona str. 200901868 TaxID=1192866 RepID=M6WIY5_LEPBO|nr:hypothetical protein LEP1GSC133_0039 [Leptospira borgpetersenii serovar Pomona str. 200901868]
MASFSAIFEFKYHAGIPVAFETALIVSLWTYASAASLGEFRRNRISVFQTILVLFFPSSSRFSETALFAAICNAPFHGALQYFRFDRFRVIFPMNSSIFISWVAHSLGIIIFLLS